ncbi:hypothetical protein A5893_06285 [Pedobacter psychrophilus]|uniref:Uncharacterized protein n=1 Tax=Pedobacter psychrophilus TaxID=1826909 RepID=A0A179DID1_9SPHI|nr:hypothetical protein [Pedobacter psychrophilus]OAQ40552.1 hypothetical protein A5893_06285 [Pedobacter psychrophilus]
MICPTIVLAQFKGIWVGYITAEGKELNSNYVLDVRDDKDGIVTGNAFLFGSEFLQFLGKMNFVGSVEQNKLKLTELKLLINNKPITNESFCIKEMVLELSSKDSINKLKGPWLGDVEPGVNCEPGIVYLNKINDLSSSLLSKEIIKEIKSQGAVDDLFLNTNLSKPSLIYVKSKKITLRIHDYEVTDGDIISVYLNRFPIIERTRIKSKPKLKEIELSPFVSVNELIVYAHNLGKIPPNTCLMEVDDGVNQQKVYITSNLQTSALIYIKYSP